MISKFIRSVVLGVAIAVTALVAEAQQTNIIGPGTNAASYAPYYSISNYFSINSGQPVQNDALVNGTTNVNYSTNNGANNLGTNGNTGAQVLLMGAPRSLNVGFSLFATLTNSAYLPGTNSTLNWIVDQSTGFGDWTPLFTNSTVMPTNGVLLSVSTNINTGGFSVFRTRQIYVSTPGVGTIVPGVTGIYQQFGTKPGL